MIPLPGIKERELRRAEPDRTLGGLFGHVVLSNRVGSSPTYKVTDGEVEAPTRGRALPYVANVFFVRTADTRL